VADPETAAQSDTLVHDEAGDNVAIRYTVGRGDADERVAELLEEHARGVHAGPRGEQE